MQTVYTIIRDNGDGSQSVLWVRDCTIQELEDKAEADPYDSYQSGDGIQIEEISFPAEWDLNKITGIYWTDLEDI